MNAAPAVAGLLLGVAALGGCAEQAKAPGPLVPGLAAALPSLDRVAVQQGDDTLVFERAGNAWMIRGAAWRADRRWLQPLLLGLAQARCDEPRTADPARYGRIGVAWPPESASAGDAAAFARPTGRLVLALDGREVAVVVGYPQARGGTFVRVEGAPHSCLTARSLRLPAQASQWFDPQLWELPLEQVAVVSVEDAGAPPLRLLRREDRFVAEGQGLPLTPMPDALVAALAAPRQQDLRPSPEAGAARSEAWRVLRLELVDGRTYAIALRREDGWTWARAIAVPEAEAAAFDRREFLLPPEVADPLSTPRDGLGA